MRAEFHIFKTVSLAAVLLSAILSGALSLAFPSPIESSAEMVYCPLTRRLQPANPPKTIAPKFSLNEICARDFEKNLFALAAATESAKLNSSSVNQTEFENLAFDFWQNGNRAFGNLPSAPNAPEKFIAKNSFAAINSGGDYGNKIVWQTTEIYAVQLKPRPPTNQNSPRFEIKSARRLHQISRRIAPRAPPVSI